MPERFSLATGWVLILTGGALAQVALPPAGALYDSQLGGAYEPAAGIGIVSRDRMAPPADGLYSICYVNAFQSQPEESAWWIGEHPELVLHRNGVPLEDPDWPGEYLLDLSTGPNRDALAEIVGAWIDQCARDGFEAVEADNLDTWTRAHDMITMDQAIAFGAMLAERAHRNGLAFGQKNAVELGRRGPDAGFDFAITENCAVYEECDDYTAVYGPHVLQIEYDRTVFDAACAERGHTDVIVLRDVLLAPAGDPGHVFETC